MWKYIGKRLLWIIPVVLGVILIVFTLLHNTPGDPAVQVLGATSTEEARQAWRDARGLNDPFFVQFFTYIKNVFTQLDFGRSYSGNREIATEIANRLPVSAKLAFITIIIDFLIGTPIGIISAVKKYSLLDNVLMFIALLMVSMPGFWIGLELSIIFAVKLGWFPVSGLYGPIYYVLPVISMALGGISASARMTRSCMLDSMSEDYIVTARAKGVSEVVVIVKHALRNSLLPIITQIGGAAAAMMGGSMITEIVFSIPGMGVYMVNSITARDYPVVLGCVVVLSTLSCLILLITDLCYALIDPRIKAQFSGSKVKKMRAKEAT